MIKYCLKKWNENQEELRQNIAEDTKLYDCDYEYLVKKVVDIILNRGDSDWRWDTKHITEIDNGDYQGTLLYLIPADSYQPGESEYLMTYVGYGSCSGCDTLLNIQDYISCGERPNEKTVGYLMSLCKDIVCNMIRPYNIGWRGCDDFETVTMDEEGE